MSAPAEKIAAPSPGGEKDVKKVSTYCYQCVNGPDMLTVEVVDGVATKVEPNFEAKGYHPADGKICVKPYGLVQKLYNPNRILRPMRRTNPRKGRDEDPGWVEISWDEALDLLAEKLRGIEQRGKTDEQRMPRLAFSTGGAGTPLFYMGTFPAFLAAWGPVDASLGAGGTVKCYHTEHLYGELWQRGFTIIPDTPLAELIISFGRNDDASGGVQGVRRHADARARGAKRVQIEPHLSVTGASARDWIPIRPKTDSAFMYAMIHVLTHEHPLEALDVPFMKHHTAMPYLIAPNGFYARDPETEKPLVWDLASGRAVPHDTPGIDPALAPGVFTCDCLERGADEDRWEHQGAEVKTAYALLAEHVAGCTPEWAGPICDVKAERIRGLANEYLAAARVGETIEIEGQTLPFRPASVILGKGINNGWGAYECVWARTVLHVLVGALEVPGGSLGNTIHINSPETDRWTSVVPGPDGFMDFPMNPTDKENWIVQPEMRHAHRTLIPMVGNAQYSAPLGSSTLTWLRLQGKAAEEWPKPNPPDVWIVYHCNPAISFSETSALEDTMATFPFTVAFSYTLDETNHYADLLLPDATDLESMQLIRIGGTHYMENFWESEGWVLRQRVVPPRGEAREFTWFTNELARRLDMLPAYNEMVNAGVCGIPLKTDRYDFSLDPQTEHSEEEVWDAICRAASTELTGGEETNGLDWFAEHGFKMRPFPRIKWYLYPRMVEMGLRFELPYQERVLRVGTELTRRMHEQGWHWWDRQLHEYEAMPAWKDLNAYWDEAIERNYDAKAEEFPMWLLGARSMQYAWGGNVSLQMIREVADNVVGHDGIMLNAQTAARLGIEQGEEIEVISPVAEARGKAIVRQGVHPDCVIMIAQFGHWKTPYAKETKRVGLNALVPMGIDFVDGSGSSIDATKVRVERVGGQR